MTLSPTKILVVDDSKLIHQMYEITLMRYKGLGSKIVHAMNGFEAFSVLRQHPDVDLIVIDINMPVMDGLTFLEKRKKDSRLSSIPAVIVSTEGKEADTIRGLEAGAMGYVKKPFKPSDLHDLIDRVLEAGVLGKA